MSMPTNVGKSRLHKFLLEGKPLSLSKQQILQTTEDREVVNVIVSGYVKKYLISNDGSIGAMIIYGPGDIFPLTLIYKKLFDQPIYRGVETFFYEAMSKTQVRSMDVDQLVKEVKHDPGLYKDLFEEAGQHLEFCIQSLENISLRNSGKRLAHFLLYFSSKFGTQYSDGVHIDIPLTHQSIAEILNLTRETVSMGMIQLRKDGLIKTKAGRQVIVPSSQKLRDEALS